MNSNSQRLPAGLTASRGFSLLEILIAVTILALMGGLVAVNLFPRLGEAKQKKAGNDVITIKEAINHYRLKHNKIPDPNEFPQCLIGGDNPGEEGFLDTAMLQGGKLLDPWDHEYVYQKNGQKFEIISYGADNSPGGEGENADISSDRSKTDK